MAKKPSTDDIADLIGKAPETPPVVQPDVTEPAAAEASTDDPVAEAAPIAQPEPELNDGVLDAHLRRQETWEEDAKKLFRGPSEEEKEREALLNTLSAIDAERNLELRRAEEERAAADKAEQEAARKKRIAELENELKTLKKAS